MIRHKQSCLLFLLLILVSLTSNLAATVNSSDAGKAWENRKTRTVKPAKSPDERSSFGGWAKHKVAEPGFFRVSKNGRKWWLIDPEGHLFLSIGVNSVEPKRVERDDKEAWGEETHQLLTNSGFNSIGRWSAPRDFRAIDKEIPWCRSLGFMANYVKNRPKNRGESGYPKETIPVFDEEWPTFCEEYAAEHVSDYVDNRFLIGHFSDNELPFRPDALSLYLSLPESDAGHQGALAWMKENRVSKGRADNPKAQAAFLEEVSKRYFNTVAVALKKVDPNHLYIGSRLHGRCISEPVLRGASVCDIVSINFYHSWKPDKSKTAEWTKWSQKPFLVGEFYAMKVTSKRTDADGAGFRVLKHEEAGEFYHTYTSALLKDHPNCVGWHWFKYADDSDDYQKGIVSRYGAPHQPLIDAMRVLNDQAYSIRGNR